MSFGTQTHRPIAQLKSATAATIENVTSHATPDTEFTYSIPDNTKSILVRVRGTGDLKLNYTSIDISTKYITLKAGAVYSASYINLVGVTLYMKCSTSSDTIEIETWV